ncbi:MAG: vWA domain-containing protein [Bdellovibrionota bacterium]
MHFDLSKIFKSALVPLVAAAVVAGCSEKSPKLVPLVPKKDEKIRDSGDETFTFNPRVDVLFVVDDSGSMEIHQQNLIKNIEAFTRELASNKILDYHFGVLTSSMSDFSSGAKGGAGKLVGSTTVIDRQTAGGLTILRDNLHVGTKGSGQEMFFDPVKAALTPPLLNAENKGFYRENAHLAVIFITDADDQSEDLSVKSYYQFLLDLKMGDPKKVIHYGIYIPTANTTCSRSGEGEPERIEELMGLFAANPLELCDVNFGQKLAELAFDLGNRVGRVMYLSRPAVPESIQVTYGSSVLPNDSEKGWIYDSYRNAVIFGDKIDWESQPTGSTIEVNFIAGQYDE